MIRKATKDDIKVLEGLQEFIESLEIDILKNYSIVKIQDILKFVFLSEYDRFSFKNCMVYESNGKIKGFSFSYHYNEVLEKEFYLDTLYVFSEYRGEGVGNKLLTSFVNSSNTLLSLNVAQSNVRARKLYESYGFYKNSEIYIGHENYDHLIKTK